MKVYLTFPIPDTRRVTNMEEGLTILPDSAQNCNLSIPDNEKQKVKEFVYKHFRETTDGSVISAEDSSMKELGCSSKKEKPYLNKTHCKIQQGAVFSGNILSFECSVCKDNTTYSPNDLLKHFRVTHKETLPTYPCDLCCFVTHEFPALQRHRIEHRNTLVTCELCNDGVQYSLLLLTRHYIMCHSQNGQFNCDWCEFITFDAGTFVQHIHHHNESPWKCLKCRHMSLSEEDYQKHEKAHSGTFPFTCQICGYGAGRSEYLKNHVTAVHKEETERRTLWLSTEESSTLVTSANLNILLKKSESQDAEGISKVSCVSGSLLNQNGCLNKAEISLEETYHSVDKAVATKENKTSIKGSHNTEQTLLQECDSFAGFDDTGNTNPNALTVLMVRNKISLPPNCTTKVMGFKMVDGKKHLVLKVIPTVKQDSSPQNQSSTESLGCTAPPQIEKSEAIGESGECPNSKSTKSNTFGDLHINGSCMQNEQDDILAVKVKIEEEEASVCNLNSNFQRNDVGEETSPRSCADIPFPIANQFDQMSGQTQPNQKIKCDVCLVSATGDISSVCGVKATGLSSLSNDIDEVVSYKQVIKNTAENCMATDGQPGKVDEPIQQPNCTKNNNYSTLEKDNPDSIRTEIKHDQQRFKKILVNLVPQLEPSVSSSGNYREFGTKNSQSQEVFTFHNYSKEKLSPSAVTAQNIDKMHKHSAMDSVHIWQTELTTEERQKPFTERLNAEFQENQLDLKKVSDCDIKFDCCVDDISTEAESIESVFQDFNIIKIEEDNIPISPKQSETQNCSSSVGKFVEEHSDAIISQQLIKEKVQNLSVSNASLKQTKSTLRILQLPTTENKSDMPVQVKPMPGFKLITNSSNPQINVSYMKPGQDRSANSGSRSLNPNSGRMAVIAPKAVAEKGTALLSALHTGVGTASNHYLISRPGLNSPVLLSSTPHSGPHTCKTTKTQPACYLLQRSFSFVQNPSTSGHRLANTQLPQNSRPVLAMPVTAADKHGTLQTGRQAFLLRYISPTKSGLLLDNQDAKTGSHVPQTNETTGNKVIFKIITPSSSLLSNGNLTSSSQPLILAASPQTQCFLVSSNKTNADTSSGIKKLITMQNTAQKDGKETLISHNQMNVSSPQSEAEKPVLAPRPVRPPSQRKRRRKQLFDEFPTIVHKARRLSNRALTEKQTTLYWKPVAKDVERTLRLAPFSSVQQVRCPRSYQPVVVLNHPDADIPEVANIMKVVNRYKGAVTKVSLSQKTVQALSEIGAPAESSLTKSVLSRSDQPQPRPVKSFVRERFLLRLKLRKKSKKKYEIVKSLTGSMQESVMFDCWFCGRLFNSQEDWIGHGQRHLMEATRDWNKLF